ncbi:MAG: tetratricopeptide repeat protein [Planctomycetota bacterium]
MRRLPAELVVLIWIAVFAGLAAFIATVVMTPLPDARTGPRGAGAPGGFFPVNLGNLPDDEATLTRVAHDRPENFAAWHKLGLVLARTGQPAAARTAQETARERLWIRLEAAGPANTNRLWGYHMLGHIKVALGDIAGAHQAFSEALRIHSGPRAKDDSAEGAGDGWSGWYNHACILSMAGHTDRALAVLTRMAERGEIAPDRSIDRRFVLSDRDLDPLRTAPAYAELLAMLEDAEEQQQREQAAERVTTDP